MNKFKIDSLNGLVCRLSDEVSSLVKTDKQTKDIQELFNEIAKRIESQDNELSDIIESIEYAKGML